MDVNAAEEGRIMQGPSGTEKKRKNAAGGNGWRFQRCGGVLQVVLEHGADLARLDTLDLKYWMALAVPVGGVEMDRETADMLDADRDGRIRPPDILEAVRWACAALTDPQILLEPGDEVPMAAIRDPALRSSARQILTALGKESAERISLAEIGDRRKVLSAARYNGDGVVTAESVASEEERRAVAELIRTVGAVEDVSGRPGLDRGKIEEFFRQAAALIAWTDRGAAAAAAPLGTEVTAAAADAVRRVREKVEDYFTRCRLAAFDPAAAAAVNRKEADYQAAAAGLLAADDERIAALPLAPAAAGQPLPLESERVNPAWAQAIGELRAKAVRPLLGADRAELAEAEWRALLDRLAPWERWRGEKPQTAVEALGLPRLREMTTGDIRRRLLEAVERDRAPAPEFKRLAEVEKLVRFRRDLRALLRNSVNFRAFYDRGDLALFQSGTLYLDGRACRLCIEVADVGRHAALATFSGAFLVYCDLARAGGLKKSMVAIVTNGDGDNIMPGRNGVFYDRQGRDWDATVIRVVANPISIREAFWSPYKKFVRLIEEQFAKRAQAADAGITARLGETAAQMAAAAPAKPPQKIDLGTIALIGTAVGGVSALVGGLLQSLFGLGFWLPLGVVGILLLISGPSMFLAALKLRRRNLGPVLDANGWAINTQARLTIAMGSALTELAVPPLSAMAAARDPFAGRKRARAFFWAALLAAVVLYGLYRVGLLGGWFPFFSR
jgi:hypothetical protein